MANELERLGEFAGAMNRSLAAAEANPVRWTLRDEIALHIYAGRVNAVRTKQDAGFRLGTIGLPWPEFIDRQIAMHNS